MLGRPERERYLAQLADYLGAQRVRHSVNGADAAVALALKHAPALAERAELAGLLHDNAKRLSAAQLIEQAQRFDIEVTPVERQWPPLLHGKVGAALLPERFGVEDAQVRAAVASHVTGQPNMDELGCILFVADQVADDRDFEGIAELRRVAPENLARAVLIVSRFKLAYAMQRGRLIEPVTVAVYNEFTGRGV
jgi:predicted HD superfamily hydrolase involved in NAD metabolism